MLAFRIASYSGQYVAGRPSVDRFGETIEKLLEDLYGRKLEPFAPRHAFVRFNEPMDVGPYLEKSGGKVRSAVRDLSADCESAVQRGGDGLNEVNRHPGALVWQGTLTA